MDVPKITVFKSPPWVKPPPAAPQPKLSNVFEEYPYKSKALTRKIIASRSLESIPENNVLKDTHHHSTTHLRDQHRLSPHQVLPPITSGRLSEDEPELRQRANSDPHKYTAIIKKKAEEKKESPLCKSTTPSSKTQTPPPAADSRPHEGRGLSLTPDNKHKNVGKESRMVNKKIELHSESLGHQPNGKCEAKPIPVRKGGILSSPASKSPLSKSPPRAAPAPRKKPAADNLPSPISSAKSTAARHSDESTKRIEEAPSSLLHPAVQSLRGSEGHRGRTLSFDSSLKQPATQRKLSFAESDQSEVDNHMAYALVGSPGRDRWPAQDRKATAFLASKPNESYASTPAEGSIEPPEVAHKPSQEYKDTLRELGFSSNFSYMTNGMGNVENTDAFFHTLKKSLDTRSP